MQLKIEQDKPPWASCRTNIQEIELRFISRSGFPLTIIILVFIDTPEGEREKENIHNSYRMSHICRCVCARAKPLLEEHRNFHYAHLRTDATVFITIINTFPTKKFFAGFSTVWTILWETAVKRMRATWRIIVVRIKATLIFIRRIHRQLYRYEGTAEKFSTMISVFQLGISF